MFLDMLYRKDAWHARPDSHVVWNDELGSLLKYEKPLTLNICFITTNEISFALGPRDLALTDDFFNVYDLLDGESAARKAWHVRSHPVADFETRLQWWEDSRNVRYNVIELGLRTLVAEVSTLENKKLMRLLLRRWRNEYV